ncbi:hypothetical protein SDJN03_16972, partial [Cucurbita argyrosperma subsp. sororia]
MKIGVPVVVVVVVVVVLLCQRKTAEAILRERGIAGVLAIPAGEFLYEACCSWLTFRRGHCRASGRIRVITALEVFEVVIFLGIIIH